MLMLLWSAEVQSATPNLAPSERPVAEEKTDQGIAKSRKASGSPLNDEPSPAVPQRRWAFSSAAVVVAQMAGSK